MANSTAPRSEDRVREGLTLLYGTEALNSIAGMLLTIGLPFYMNHRFGWGARENFTVAALQGVFYVFGALSAKRISNRWGRGRSLFRLYAGAAVLACAVGAGATMAWAHAVALLIVLQTFLLAASWPMLESLVSESGEPARLSKRLGGYNIVWASTGALAVAASGAVIQHTPAWGFFGIAAAGHVLGVALIFRRNRLAAGAPPAEPAVRAAAPAVPAADAGEARDHRLALWLSRIALPSTYVIVYSIAPALPSLHAVRRLSPTVATVVCSIWLMSRAAAFLVTARTTFWHRRPGLIPAASAAMLAGFLGVIAAGAARQADLLPALAAMAVAQVVLGLSLGTIYAASLYFGMAVSEGSTEHGGYHEALIGLGQVLGPLVGATMQWLRPGAIWPAVAGISAVVAASIGLQAVVGVRNALYRVVEQAPQDPAEL